MKAEKSKQHKSKKEVKPQTEKLEVNLSKKIKEFVVSLGHDAEDIGDEIKKTSKILAKRLKTNLKKTQKEVSKKISVLKKEEKALAKDVSKLKSDLKRKGKDKAEKISEAFKKETKKLAKKAAEASETAKAKAKAQNKSIKKTAKKKAEPIAQNGNIEVNNHPETPVLEHKKTTKAPIPKSASKPQNKDLPFEAGPPNKYKRG